MCFCGGIAVQRQTVLTPMPSEVQWERQRRDRIISEVNSTRSGPSTAPPKVGYCAVFSRLSLCHAVLCFPKAASGYLWSAHHSSSLAGENSTREQDNIHHFPCLEATRNDHRSYFCCRKQCLCTNSLVPSHTVSPTFAFVSTSCVPGGFAGDWTGRWTGSSHCKHAAKDSPWVCTASVTRICRDVKDMLFPIWQYALIAN